MMTETLSTIPAAGPADVLAAIKTASRETGSDFDYLLAVAKRESNLDSKAKSKSSSASGLFQFIDQTWLSLIKRYGAAHGLGHHADAISRTESGRLVTRSPQTRSAILALREDPEISARMAGEAAAATKQSLECSLGRAVCAGELYAAHFLGEGGARRLIGLNERQPGAPADLAFPEAAKANRAMFYHADGRAKAVCEVYACLVGDSDAPAAPTSGSMVAGQPGPVEAARARSADADEALGITVRGSRLVFEGWTQPASAGDSTLPRSPLSLSAGLLDILAAAFEASFARRQG